MLAAIIYRQVVVQDVHSGRYETIWLPRWIANVGEVVEMETGTTFQVVQLTAAKEILLHKGIAYAVAEVDTPLVDLNDIVWAKPTGNDNVPNQADISH